MRQFVPIPVFRKVVPNVLIQIPVSAGELIDKITILEIKSSNITDPAKKANVEKELQLLTAVVNENIPDISGIKGLWTELHAINNSLWVIEDDIRDKERSKEFDAEFIELARRVYITNDRRADVKRQINLAVGSILIEEKSYQAY
jgi:hypothetical protein